MAPDHTPGVQEAHRLAWHLLCVGVDAALEAPLPPPTPRPGAHRVVSLDEAVALVAGWRAAGHRVATTNGCFDLLHEGHVIALAEARVQADHLAALACNTDASVGRAKGPGRPVVPFEQRAAVLAALRPVDLVVPLDDDLPTDALRRLGPDVHVKGAEYDRATCPRPRRWRTSAAASTATPWWRTAPPPACCVAWDRAVTERADTTALAAVAEVRARLASSGPPTIVVVGDVMLDRYVDGTSTRLSPEAPVPVVDVRGEYLRAGWRRQRGRRPGRPRRERAAGGPGGRRRGPVTVWPTCWVRSPRWTPTSWWPRVGPPPPRSGCVSTVATCSGWTA